MKRWLAVGGAFTFFGLMLGGCSGKTESGAGSVPLADFAGSFAQSLCESLSRCCSGVALTYDAAQCVSTKRAELQRVADQESARRVTYDPMAAGSCLRALEGANDCGSGAATVNIRACNHMFVGALAKGEVCIEDGECSSDSCLTDQNDVTRSLCADQSSSERDVVVGKNGDACDLTCWDTKTCPLPPKSAGASAPVKPRICQVSEGLRCHHTCQPLGQLGAECTFSAECETGLYCGDRRDPVSAGHCAVPVANGAVCDQYGGCESGACMGGVCVAFPVTAEQCTTGSWLTAQ